MDMQHPLNSVTFAMQRAARAMGRKLEAELRPLGLSAPQFTTLSLMSPGKPETVAALAARLGTERTTMSRNLAVLVCKGWLDVTAKGHILSAEGREVLAQALPLWKAHQTKMLRQLGEDFGQTLIYNARRL
jgi:DNA-binding MarR family transcriptional regulator